MSANPAHCQETLDPGTAPDLPKIPAQGLLQQAQGDCHHYLGLTQQVVNLFEV